MVTIGPLIVLGLLGVTFYIGARAVTPVATDLPTIPVARSRPQSATNVLQITERLGSDPVMLGENTSGSPSSPNASQVMELPRFGPVLQRGRLSGGSGDAMTLSRSEHPTTRTTNVADQHRSTGGERESSDGGTVNHRDSATERPRGLAASAKSPFSEEISPGKTERSTGSGLGTETGNKTNPEEVKIIRYSAGGGWVSQ